MKIILSIFIILLSLQPLEVAGQKKLKFKKSKGSEKAQFAEYEFTEGMKYYILGNYSEAISHFETSQKFSGENAAINYLFSNIYFKRNRLELALQYANKALKLDSKNKFYYLHAATINEKLNNIPEAIRIYKKLISEVGGTQETYEKLSELLFITKNYDEAYKYLEKLENITGKSLEITQAKQEILSHQGNFEKAKEEGEKLIKAFPEESYFKIAQADFLFRNNRTEQAVNMMEEILKADPENSYARLFLSDMYKAMGKTDKSDKEIEKVFNDPQTDLETKLEILGNLLKAPKAEYQQEKVLSLAKATVSQHSNASKAYAVYGEALRRAGKKEEAWLNFVKAKNLDNANLPIWLELFALDSELNKPDSLIKHSEEALESFPNQATVWMYNGIGYSLNKKFDKATEALEEGKKLAGKNAKLLLQFNLQLGDAYNSKKEFAKSDAAFDEVLKLDPENSHALNNYSYFLSLRKEKLEIAQSMSKKLVQLYPQEPGFLDTHAWVLYQLKNYEEAKNFLEKALESSEDGTIREHYGDVLYKLNQKEQAVEQWKKAKSLGGTSDFIDKKIAEKKLYE